jgi:hypothetical protein
LHTTWRAGVDQHDPALALQWDAIGLVNLNALELHHASLWENVAIVSSTHHGAKPMTR